MSNASIGACTCLNNVMVDCRASARDDFAHFSCCSLQTHWRHLDTLASPCLVAHRRTQTHPSGQHPSCPTYTWCVWPSSSTWQPAPSPPPPPLPNPFAASCPSTAQTLSALAPTTQRPVLASTVRTRVSGSAADLVLPLKTVRVLLQAQTAHYRHRVRQPNRTCGRVLRGYCVLARPAVRPEHQCHPVPPVMVRGTVMHNRRCRVLDRGWWPTAAQCCKPGAAFPNGCGNSRIRPGADGTLQCWAAASYTPTACGVTTDGSVCERGWGVYATEQGCCARGTGAFAQGCGGARSAGDDQLLGAPSPGAYEAYDEEYNELASAPAPVVRVQG